MVQYKQSDNAEITEIINNSANTSETIESISDEVYVITLPSERTINSFFLNLALEKDDYDYGIAYVDILKENEFNTDHNRNFNTYAFFFEKNSSNTINQLLDVNDYIYINFLPHPAFDISRTQKFNRLKSDDLVYVPVFPEQKDVLKDGKYLPLFPLDLNNIDNISNIIEIKDSDYYEIRNDTNKIYLNIDKLYNVFDYRNNIKLFEDNLLDNFGCFPMGMFGTQIQNDPPFLFHLPNNQFADIEGLKPLASNEYESIFNSSGSTIATKSNLEDSAIMRYITLTNKNTKSTGGIDGKYIKVSIDFYSKEAEFGPTSVSEATSVSAINNYQEDFLTPGTASNESLMQVKKINTNGQPILVDIYINKSTGTASKQIVNEFNFNINNTSEYNSAQATPQNISQKINTDSNLGSDINSFINNFNPEFAVNSSQINEYFIVGYELINSEEDNISFEGYEKNSNQTQQITKTTGLYAKYKVRIIWSE